MAFVTGPALPATRSPGAAAVCNKHVRMSAEPVSRRVALSAALSAAAAVALPLVAGANIEYANVGFLGGGDKIDVVCCLEVFSSVSDSDLHLSYCKRTIC